MSSEQAAPETKGVTAEVLATVDLGSEIEGMAGRQLRMRLVTFEPGGVFGPIHDHKDRPGIVYVLQGTITDHRNGVTTDHGPGVGWPERFRRWRSRSTSSGRSRRVRGWHSAGGSPDSSTLLDVNEAGVAVDGDGLAVAQGAGGVAGGDHSGDAVLAGHQ